MIKVMPAPIPAAHLVSVGVGVGKSHAAREETKRIVSMLPHKTCLVIASPTHALNDEHAERLKALLEGDGVNVAVYRGREAKDPDRPGHNMCDYAVEAAELAAVGGQPLHLCSRTKDKKSSPVFCKHFDECGYRKQKSLKPRVWIVAHTLLTRKPPTCINEVAALIIDEDPLQSFLGGFGHPVRVSMDELRQVRHVPAIRGSKRTDDEESADLANTTALLLRVLLDNAGMVSSISVKRLVEQGLTAEAAHAAMRAVYRSQTNVEVSPNMPPYELRERIKEAAIHNQPIFRLARLFRLIGDAISAGHDIVPGCRFERAVLSGNGPQYDAVRLRWLKDLHADWHAPTMILSATARPSLLSLIWTQLEHITDVNPKAPYMSVRQITWSASQSKLQNEKHLHRLKRCIEVRAFEYRGKGNVVNGRRVDVLVIAQLKIEESLKALMLPDNVDTAHFNAVEGIDKWGGVACLISIGRTMPSPDDVEMMAEVLTGEVVERDTSFDGGWYPRKPVGIRLRGKGEVGHPTIAEEHPHDVAEALRKKVCEAGLIQAIGRGRGVNRKSVNPLHVDFISTQPLPLEVDEVQTKDAIDPNPYLVMAARGLVVDEMATKGKWQIVTLVLSDLYPSPNAAKVALNVRNANKKYLLANVTLSGFVSATVRLKGARYAVPVLIDGSRGNPREVAENLLGPLASFKVLSVDTTAHAAVAADSKPVAYLDPSATPAPRTVGSAMPWLAADNPEPEPVEHPFDATLCGSPEEVYRHVVADMGDLDWLDAEAAGTEAAGRWLAAIRASASISQLTYPPRDYPAVA